MPMRSLLLHCTVLCALALSAELAPAAASAQDRNDAANPLPADLTVRFRDRRIDLRPYFEGFPYRNFRAEYDDGRLFYFRDGRAGRELWTLPLEGEVLALERGTRVGEIDWNTRALRAMWFHAPTGQYIVIADEANEERFNLYALTVAEGRLERLTNHPYVYGYGLDKQNHFMGYVPRYGTSQPYRSCLNLLDVSTRLDQEVVCDTPEMTFTWTEVNFRPDASGVLLGALRASDRNHENIVYVDLRARPASVRPLLDVALRRRNVGTVREWLDNDRFVYTSDESGFTNVYVFDLRDGTSRQITHFTEDVDDVVPLRAGGRYLLGVMIKRPYESELAVIDPETGVRVQGHVFDATAVFLDYRDDRALVQSESRRTRFSLDELVLLPEGDGFRIELRHRAGVPEDVAARIEQCEVERVAIPTFDTDARTGRRRVLHAYLQTPRHPPREPSGRFALVEAFYGGENVFDIAAQIYCEAGGSVLSPSVRGSSGFGAEFAALNDHDLGGNEVFDLMESARWLRTRLGLRERQVGLFGSSHGGYEVMRALTFPPEVNGRRDHYEWGFGISYFGFSNILSFYETCNIPDWVLLEAGDPRSERERLLDRSPLTHAARAMAPLLLLHGENDNRVPVRESRQMAEALRRAHRPVTYVEFPGQGHGLKGVANQFRVWTTVFEFLERELPGTPRSRLVSPRRGRAWRLAALGAVLVLVLGAGAWAARERR